MFFCSPVYLVFVFSSFLIKKCLCRWIWSRKILGIKAVPRNNSWHSWKMGPVGLNHTQPKPTSSTLLLPCYPLTSDPQSLNLWFAVKPVVFCFFLKQASIYSNYWFPLYKYSSYQGWFQATASTSLRNRERTCIFGSCNQILWELATAYCWPNPVRFSCHLCQNLLSEQDCISVIYILVWIPVS